MLISFYYRCPKCNSTNLFMVHAGKLKIICSSCQTKVEGSIDVNLHVVGPNLQSDDPGR